MSYNSGLIELVISNQPCPTRWADLKSLARLLPELYSTESYYHYLSILFVQFTVRDIFKKFKIFCEREKNTIVSLVAYEGYHSPVTQGFQKFY